MRPVQGKAKIGSFTLLHLTTHGPEPFCPDVRPCECDDEGELGEVEVELGCDGEELGRDDEVEVKRGCTGEAEHAGRQGLVWRRKRKGRRKAQRGWEKESMFVV